ncbi:Smad nuclear-interacting protein 1 [Phytophthora citrophthora]|uniref:Smad nuclear-interacting protein 1 n=1 Tax=Phytophthora citrophthora TaxID=4793 RepID=A0AAD9LHH4_9STRA|nr:Smad nuclear-interacting protein 1 [Phytophthora citrophthora]
MAGDTLQNGASSTEPLPVAAKTQRQSLAKEIQPRRGRREQQSREKRSPRNQDKKTRDFSHLVQWGKQEDEEKEEEPVEVEKPNFGLTGALAKDQTTGNMQNGVVMKFSEPPEAREPTKRYRLYVFKDDKNIATLHVHRKSAFLVGRDKAVADILTEHPSCSKQHAVLQYRMYQKEMEDGLGFEQEVRPYIMDLDSTNSTFLNGHKIDGSRYIELKEKDVLKFGDSTREYVLMCAT